MPKERRSRPKEKQTQHDKFVSLARERGADESETAFVQKMTLIARAKSPKQPSAKKPKPNRSGRS